MIRKKPAKEPAVIKQSESEALEYAESILNTLREPLLALGSDLRVIKVNRSFCETFKVTPAETLGQLIYDLGNKQWDIPELRNLLEGILPQKSVFNDYEVEHDFTTIGRRTMLLNARQVQGLLGKQQVILLAIEDITLRKGIEARLERTHYQELEAINIVAGKAGIFAENILNTVREPLLALDPDLRVIKASHSFYETFKVTPAETLGQLVYNLGNKQWDIPKLRELLESILPQKSVFNDYEVEHDFTTIGSRTMLLNAREIKQDLGRPLFILLAIEDITLRIQAEKALRESEDINRRLSDYYRQLNDISIAFGMVVDTADLFSEIAESFRLLTGANAASFSVYDQEASVLKVMSLSIAPMLKDNVISMFGTDLFKLQIPVSADDIKQMLTQHIRRPKDLHELSSGQLPRDISEAIMNAIDSRQIVALAISYAGEIMGTCIAYLRGDQPVVPDDALKTYIQISALAVKRKRAEEKWQAALAYNRSLIEASLDPLVTINAEGHITDVNLATEKVTGCLRGEIIGTDFSDYFTEPEKARAGYQQVLTAGFVIDYPLDIRHRDGQITPVFYNAVVYRDDQGQVLGIFAAARDVTERKRNDNLILLQTSVLKILASDIPATQTADKVVEVIKHLTGYDAVGLRLQVGSDYPFVASLGYSADFLKAENTLLNRYPDGGLCRNADGTIDLECTCGMIISGKTDAGNPLFTAGGSAWTNNSLPFLDAPPDTDTRLHPRNRCIHVGFLSLALIPIRAGAERMGLLHLADRKQDQFTPEAIRFYEGIGASIGVALAHKKSETALHKEQMMLARTEDIAHVGSWEWEIATDTVTWSEELFRIFQREPQKGAPSFAEHPALYHPNDFALLNQAVEAAVADGTPYELELRTIRKDGETHVCVARGVAEMGPGGRAVRLFGSLQDITERKKGEESLRKSEEQYRLLSEHTTDTVWLMDMNVKLTYFSPSVEKLRGFTPREVIAMPIEQHVTPNSFKLVNEVILQEIPKVEADVNYNPVLTLDIEYTCKDGTTVWTENKFSVIRDENGKAISILGEARNITERKQAAEELKKSYESLKKTLNDAISTMVKIVN